MTSIRPFATVAILFASAAPLFAGNADLPMRAEEGLEKAVRFFQQEVSVEGGYLWRYSDDLRRREGERSADATTAWVQPPGTPAVGMALLDAYRQCGKPMLWEAALQSARALVNGQLRSGGWDYRIEFAADRRKHFAYRVEPPREGARNTTTLDDNVTQSAARFLIEIDTTRPSDARPIHEAALFALRSLVKAQYPNGAWPQRFESPPDPNHFPVKKAGYPDTWPRTFPKVDYRGFYTFNDGTISDMIRLMFRAADAYAEPAFQTSAERAADFILLAQMPEPQPAWAQQYDNDMHPAWARHFEPPAITGGESQGVMETLLFVYQQTGKKKYLDALPPAIAYFRRSTLPDGRLARFYELKTNQPLFFTKDYRLTYRPDDLPTHYGFIAANRIDRIEHELVKLADTPRDRLMADVAAAPRLSPELVAQVESILAAQDRRGAWVETGRLRYQGDDDSTSRVIRCDTFARNVRLLARYLAAISSASPDSPVRVRNRSLHSPSEEARATPRPGPP